MKSLSGIGETQYKQDNLAQFFPTFIIQNEAIVGQGIVSPWLENPTVDGTTGSERREVVGIVSWIVLKNEPQPSRSPLRDLGRNDEWVQ